MADKYIKVQDAKDEFYYALADRDCAISDYREAYELLDGVEAADVRPVVRCKNCIHHYYAVDCAGMCRLGIGNSLLDDDFCSRGESNCGADMREAEHEPV